MMNLQEGPVTGRTVCDFGMTPPTQIARVKHPGCPSEPTLARTVGGDASEAVKGRDRKFAIAKGRRGADDRVRSARQADARSRCLVQPELAQRLHRIDRRTS